MHYVYAHYIDNKPVYIGKGKDDRAYDSRDYDGHDVNILINDIDEDKALELEEWLINLIGIDNLYNKYKKGAPSKYYIDYDNFSVEGYSIERLHRLAEKVFDEAIKGNKRALELVRPHIENLLKTIT